jgi:hypothetical protein
MRNMPMTASVSAPFKVCNGSDENAGKWQLCQMIGLQLQNTLWRPSAARLLVRLHARYRTL